ncbi:MAG: AraC family transcriptional regulator [Planctomycetota bacterium]
MKPPYVVRRQFVSTSLGPLLLLEKEHPTGVFLPRHDHEEGNFTLILSGGNRETVQGRDHDCGPGTLLVKPGDAHHENRYGDRPTRSFVAAWLDNRQSAAAPRGIRFRERGLAVDAAWRMYAEFLNPSVDAALIYEGLLWEVLTESPSTTRRQPPSWLRQVHNRVVEEYRRGLSLQTLAREASVNPEHLSRAFRAYYGIQLGHYVQRLRTEWVANALRSSPRSLAQIAQEAGFCDQSHLNRVFGRAVGISPGRFRRERRATRSREV